MGGTDYLLGRRLPTQDLTPIAWHLRDIGILAELTAKVAADRSNGEGGTAWIEVEERLLFDGVHSLRERQTIHQRV